MNDAEIRSLVARRESTALDFKELMYPNNDAGTAELAKDIVAMANLLPRYASERAHILIGVRELPDGTGEIVGFNPESWVNDAALQQKVRSQLNRSPTFSWATLTVDGLTIGVLEISSGPRPFFALRDKASLKRHHALIRVGSSTDIASPDQIVEWATQDTGISVRLLEAEKLEAEQLLKPKVSPAHRHENDGLLTQQIRLSNEGLSPFEIVQAVCFWQLDHEKLRGNSVRLREPCPAVPMPLPYPEETIRPASAVLIVASLHRDKLRKLFAPLLIERAEGKLPSDQHLASVLSHCCSGRVQVQFRNLTGSREATATTEFRWSV